MIYFFGCLNGRVGHSLVGQDLRSTWTLDVGAGKLDWHELDGTFAPGAETKPPRFGMEHQVEGHAALRRWKGFTILAFWDRSVDKRGNSNAAFICPDVAEQMTFDAMVRRAREAFPQIWARFRFEVVET